ncbi:Lrp/AsnC family transcriptional regulator, partial [Escherichia coli]|nr:Lrp/AsnC family transcriptional regulator [Escherichia coli]
MDKFDRAILDILQTDCTRSVADIAERIGLGSTACWRRIQKLEEAGIIDRRVALLNPQRLNVSVSVFAAIRTNQHNAAWLEQFHAAVGEL